MTTQLKETIAKIEQDSLNSQAWQTLLNLVSFQNDLLSQGSLQVILRGVLAANNQQPREKTSLRQILNRLARSYNNYGLMKEAGLLYKNEYHLTEVARSHFERAKALGSTDPELTLLLEEKPVNRSANPRNLGVSRVLGERKIAKSALRKTGRMDLLLKETRPAAPLESELVQHSAPESPNECLKQAIQAISTNHNDHAFFLMNNLDCASLPIVDVWSVWADLGETYYHEGNYTRAEQCYRKACTLQPDLMMSHFNWGTALLVEQNLSLALEEFFTADAIEPGHPKVWCNIGNVYFLQNNFAGAIAALRRAVAIKPNYARAWDNLGCAWGVIGRTDEAKEACEQALALKPDYVEAIFKLGILNFIQGRCNDALHHFTSSLSKPELAGYSHAYISMTLSKLGNIAGARQGLENAKLSINDPELLGAAWAAFGWALSDDNELQEARDAQAEAVRLCPDNGDYWTNLGQAHQALDEHEEARACFQRASNLENSLVAVA